jgi:hypothetical protein
VEELKRQAKLGTLALLHSEKDEDIIMPQYPRSCRRKRGGFYPYIPPQQGDHPKHRRPLTPNTGGKRMTL